MDPGRARLFSACVALSGGARGALRRRGLAVAYTLFGALLSVNALRLHTTIAPFVITQIAVAATLRTRFGWTLGTQLSALVVLLVGSKWLQADANVFVGNALNGTGLTLVAIAVSHTALGAMVREVTARKALAGLHAELEQRVAKQVEEIVARAPRSKR